MKKLLLTLLAVLIITTGFISSVSAQTTTITLDYLKNTLGMSDEEILSAGLGFVYTTGDKVSINFKADEKIDAGRGEEKNFEIASGTNFDMEFEVAKVEADDLILVANEALPVGLTSLALSSDTNQSTLTTAWIDNFLNEKIYSMMNDNLKSYMKDSQAFFNNYKQNASGVLVDYTDEDYFTREFTFRKLFIPSFKQLGFGNTYTVSGSDVLYGLGASAFTLYKTSAKSSTIKNGDASIPYWTGDGLRIGSDNYYLATSSEGLVKKNATETNYAGIIFGFTVGWSTDTKNGKTHVADAVLTSDSVEVTSYVPSTYTVTLPKTISLSKDGFSQFTYNVSGDVEEDYKVYVVFDQTSTLKYQGDVELDDITMNIFNQKVSYTRDNCLENDGAGYTSTVTVKNEAPRAGTWKGTLPITISLANS